MKYLRHLLLFLFIALFISQVIFVRWGIYYIAADESTLKFWYPHFYGFVPVAIWMLMFFRIVFMLLLLLTLAILFYRDRKLVKTFFRTKEFKLFILSFAIALLIAEIILRIAFGIRPGVHTNLSWFTEVDTLHTLQGFSADENGITKIDTGAAQFIEKQLQQYRFPNPLPNIPKDKAMEVYSIQGDYWILGDPSFHNEFADYLHQLQQKTTSERDDFENEIIHYSTCPINTDGYKSISFKNYKTSKKKVLLLGDSFTWGHSTNNKTSSFADILLARGYVVYNTGITCADPTQYLAIAQKYISILKPDVVIVNFFMGNDIQYYFRKPQPFIPLFYATNAGNLLACPHGIYFHSPQEAYRLVKSYGGITQSNFINRFCSLTAVSSLCWKALNRFNLVTSGDDLIFTYWQKAANQIQKTPVCNHELKKIQTLCKTNNAAFCLSVIDDIQSKELSTPRKIPHLFEGLDYYESPVTIYGYNTHDYHYNDEGHKHYAGFLEELIQQAVDTAAAVH